MQVSSDAASFESPTAEMDTAALFSTVLLIEDEAAHAKLIMRALRGIVGEVTHVGSAKEALRAIESTFFELVLSDLHLPDMSGIELLHAIGAARPDLPIIVMTSSASLDDAVGAMREGAWDYTVKQFSEDLIDRIKIVVVRTAKRRLYQLRELKLRAERDAFWTAVHTAQDGVAILGSSGHPVFMNERFAEFCRLLAPDSPADATVGLVDMIEKQDPGVAQAFHTRLASGGGEALWSSEVKVIVPGADGAKPLEQHFELTLSSVPTLGFAEAGVGSAAIGELRRSVVWVKNITQRKEQEKFQRDLLATTTHDLKGPLGAILTSAELLTTQAQLTDSRLQDLITRIASCARNSINLIDELLSARRIQDGVLVVKPNWYSAGDVLEDVVLDYRPLAKAKSINFSCRPVEETLQVYADKLGLNRVLGNLVSNAIKYTERGGEVQVSADRIGSTVRFSVADSGSGIDAKSRAALFERYSRLDQHREIEGTGLGLYVTKNIVDAHNGRIEITSELGVGTTFAVYFPDPAALAIPNPNK